MPDLTSLSITRVDQFDIEPHWKTLEMYDSLVITHSAVDVSGLFNRAPESSFRLREVNFSGCTFQRALVPNFFVRGTLRKIVLDRVKFTFAVFADFMRYCLQSANSFSLSLKWIGFGLDELSKVMADVSGSLSQVKSFALEELFWDGNPLCPGLIDLLARCPALMLLSLNDCFRANDPCVPKLADLLRSTKSIADLQIGDNCMQPQLQLALLAALRGNSTIRRLSIANNVRTKAFLTEFAAILLVNSGLESVDLRNDDSLPSADIEQFLTSLADRESPLHVEIETTGTSMEAMLRRLEAGAGQGPDQSRGEEVDGMGRSGSGDVLVPDDDRWDLPVAPGIPEIDDSALLGRFEAEFSIGNLVEEIRKG
jgi:hypothetical protein